VAKDGGVVVVYVMGTRWEGPSWEVRGVGLEERTL